MSVDLPVSEGTIPGVSPGALTHRSGLSGTFLCSPLQGSIDQMPFDTLTSDERASS